MLLLVIVIVTVLNLIAFLLNCSLGVKDKLAHIPSPAREMATRMRREFELKRYLSLP